MNESHIPSDAIVNLYTYYMWKLANGPVGQIWPVACFGMGLKLKMAFIKVKIKQNREEYAAEIIWPTA